MSPSFTIWRRCGVVLAVAAAPALAGDGYRMFFVPAGDDPLDYPAGPTVIHAASYRGGTLRMEVFLENAPEPVRGIGPDHDCEAAGGIAGSVVYEDGSGAINRFRPDFVFFQRVATISLDSNSCSQYGFTRAGTALNSGDLVVTEPKYVYEFTLTISPDAAGEFTIDFTGGAGVVDENSASITGLTLETLIVSLVCDPDEADCNDNGVLDACDIGRGTSGDCNSNGVPDECDVSIGSSVDCNGNDVPDECEPDCNGVPGDCELDCDGDGLPDGCEVDCNANGSPDDCDIADGTSTDADGDGKPDECVFRLFFVPGGDDPRDYPVGPTVLNAPGLQSRTMLFEIFIANAPEPIRGVEADFLCIADASAAISGSIDYVPGTAAIDASRSDDFLASCGNVNRAVDQRCDPDVRLAAATFDSAGCPNASIAPSYVGQFDLAISADAGGTFVVDFALPGTEVVDRDLQLIPGLVTDPLIISLGCPPSTCVEVSECACDGLDGCTLARCIDGECVYSPKLAADVNRNAAVDLFDVLCVLDAFAGKFDQCAFADADVAGCQADGKIDLADIFAVLDGFAGADACLATCGHPVCVGSCVHP